MSRKDVLTAAVWALTNLGSFDASKTANSMKSKCSEWRAGRGSIKGVRPNNDAIDAAEEAAKWLEALGKKKSLVPG